MPVQKQEPGRRFACGVSRREVGISAHREQSRGIGKGFHSVDSHDFSGYSSHRRTTVTSH
jgi:hypothetical protein